MNSALAAGSLAADLLLGVDREAAIEVILQRHYTRSVPAGKTHYFKFGDAIVSFSIPANKNIAKFVLGRAGNVWELSRMWAPDGHDRNLLTMAISGCIKKLRQVEKSIDALVSYADPNVGHEGYVYKAASWVLTGRCEESRYYIGPNNEIASRRKFHSGKKILRKAEIEALDYTEAKMPGKIRFCKGLTRAARKSISARFERMERIEHRTTTGKTEATNDAE
jgi:hypothetical protein